MNGSDKKSTSPPRWYRPAALWRSFSLHPRVYLAALAAGLVAFLSPSEWSPSLRGALSWCAGGLTYLGFAVRLMSDCRVDAIKARAAQQDEGASALLILVLLAVLSSMAAIAGLMSEAKLAGGSKLVYVALCGFTILVSWAVTQVVFTLHYAHEHYAPDNLRQDSPGGLIFPHDKHPDYWDFFYFATSIGAASQTSDVMVAAKGLRHLVTLHSIVAFFFNTMVLALSINLAASLL